LDKQIENLRLHYLEDYDDYEDLDQEISNLQGEIKGYIDKKKLKDASKK
jgi:hypothetical protein